jgi:hypothetical protein
VYGLLFARTFPDAGDKRVRLDLAKHGSWLIKPAELARRLGVN